MSLRAFRRAGHLPTLLCAFLYFDVSFMVWVLVGALAVSIAADLGLDPQRDAFWKGLLVGVPILGGSLLRPVLGVLTDHAGGRRTGLLGMLLTAVPLLLGWWWAHTYAQVLVVGLLLGVAGASFAAALPLAGRWYPPQYQGLVLGLAGAGNSGTALATCFGPLLAASLGWHAVFGLALVPLLATLGTFFLLARDSPGQPPPRPLYAYAAVLGRADAWWFCLLYAVTFGGFVGLASFLSTFFKDQYFAADPGRGAVYAGYCTTLCVVAGSFLRPVGGYLADRCGGVRVLVRLYLGVALALGGLAALPPLPAAVALLVVGMGMLGMGNGAVFQLVPLRFPGEVGVLTGVVGAAGGAGGFVLPNLLGGLKGLTGSFGSGLAVFAAVSGACAGLLLALRPRWEATFLARPQAAAAAGPAGLAVPAAEPVS